MIRIKSFLQLTSNHLFLTTSIFYFFWQLSQFLLLPPLWIWRWSRAGINGDFFLVILHTLKKINAKFQLVVIFGWVTVVYAVQQLDYKWIFSFKVKTFLKNKRIKKLCSDIYFTKKMYPNIRILCQLGQWYRVK